MKFFTKYSFISNVASILIVTVGVLYIGDRALDGGRDPNDKDPGDSVELTAYNFHYNGYDENGKLSTYFIAQKLEQYVNQNLKMTNIIEKNYDAVTQKITWQFKSHHATTQKITTGDLIHLYDGVNSIVYTKSDSSDSSKGKTSDEQAPKKIHIISSEMYYNTETKDFYTSKFVKMFDPANGNNTTGNGVFGNSETKKINLNNNVRSYYAFG
ncbi:LPS export ABC transporter periplasmic protein LptC [Francisella sp. Scap27]|uniref:LPS export ABC transporter periplasmic protein LptC n=1 Tax=Francisella sp. Scap27 TaxID=2589986 RepID=UPI0015B7B850|nr:LPS export ABC transporter periplasmic protein LptC [Francisella sp. Scap27]QLE78396.1 LPS export ABC transporter periplasmic protein LptC [Francisella sp. Scap27]